MVSIDRNLIIAEVLLAAGLWVLAGVAEEYENSKWKLLYLVPALAGLLFVWAGGAEISMLPVYASALVTGIGFFREKKRVRRTSCAAGGLLALLGAVVCVANPAYRAPDFVKGFQEGFEGMKAHYCLTEHKEIDWDALYAKYLPKFEEVNAHHDRVEDVLVWNQFTREFYDGHVNFHPYEEEAQKSAFRRGFGKDYGLSLLRLTDGRIVAVNVEEKSKAEEAGIRNGTQIVGWDGQSPDALTDRVEQVVFASPDLENDAFYRILHVAGLGGDTVAVDFLDEEGVQRQAILPAAGDYCDRLKSTLDILDQGMNIGTLTWREISGDTVLFRVKEMSYDSQSYEDGDFSGMRREMEEKILQYKQEGKTRLIMDLRSNGGGSPFMILTMAELLGGEGTHFYINYGVLDEKTCEYLKDEETGKYQVGGDITFQGRDMWSHGEIILLVNGQCVSAGDHFTDMMSKMDNVTVMGLTKSNASGQAVRYVRTESGVLTFSAIPALDENGDIYIDTDRERISKIPLDVRIPLDDQAVRMLFDEGEDYALWYVQNH